MAATAEQIAVLIDSHVFRDACRALLLKTASYIQDHVRTNGTVESPAEGGTAVYTDAQKAKADAVIGAANLDSYIPSIASSGNVIASTVTYDFKARCAVSSMTEAELASQIETTVFMNQV